LLFFLFVLVAVSARAADEPVSANDFTRDFVRILRETAPNYTVRPTRELQVVVTDAGGVESTIFLYDAYARYRKSPKDEERIIRKSFLSVLSPQDEVHKLDRSRVVPVVKMRRWLDELRDAAKAKGYKEDPEVVYDDLNEQLIVAYAEDTPNTFRYVTPEQLDE